MNKIAPIKIVFGALLIFFIWGFYSCYYTVGPDEKAVILRFGKYLGTYPPGLHFKAPFGVDKMYVLKTQTVHQLEFGFRTQKVKEGPTEYSNNNYDVESMMLTGDLNVADVEWVVQYQISDPYKYLFVLKNPSKNPFQNLRDISESVMRRVVGDRPVNSVLTTGRDKIGIEAKLLMQELIDKLEVGIRILNVELQDVNPPEKVKPSFNEVNAAKQEQERDINDAQRRYNQVIPEAKGKAEQSIAVAEGEAAGLVRRARGDVAHFQAMLSAYQKAPQVFKKRIYIQTMDEILPGLQDLMIVDKDLKNIFPLLPTGSAKKVSE